jgi:hypothetical protein
VLIAVATEPRTNHQQLKAFLKVFFTSSGSKMRCDRSAITHSDDEFRFSLLKRNLLHLM